MLTSTRVRMLPDEGTSQRGFAVIRKMTFGFKVFFANLIQKKDISGKKDNGSRSFGGSNWDSHPWVLCLDGIASSSEIPVIRIQDRVPTGSGTWCISRSLVGLAHRLTPRLPHSLS